jgi:hypothetical protein
MAFPFDRLAALNVRITRLVADSRLIQSGDIFVAYTSLPPSRRVRTRSSTKRRISFGTLHGKCRIWPLKIYVLRRAN